MKLAFLNDLHAGLSGSSQLFQDEIKAFFADVFFPWVDANEVEAVIIAGDLYDNRRDINVRAMMEVVRESFLDELQKRNIRTIITLGNHDVYYRNKVKPNSVASHALEYDCVEVIEEPTELTIGDVNFLALPWICDSNEVACAKAVASSKSPYLVAHLELIGFEMDAGQIATHGQDAGLYSKFQKVFTGHYHTRSQKDNILYMGSQYQMTRADLGQSKGFYVMDLDTQELERVINPRELFIGVKAYSDEIEGQSADHWFSANSSKIDGKILTVTFDDDCTEAMVDKCCTILETSSVADYKVVDSLSRAIDSGTYDSEIQVADTMTLMSDHVRESGAFDDLDQELLIEILGDAHREALGGHGDD